MTTFMNLVIEQVLELRVREDLALGYFATTRHRYLLLLRALGAVLGTALLAIVDAVGVERCRG